jgi:hypothetical protein
VWAEAGTTSRRFNARRGYLAMREPTFRSKLL